MSSEAKNPQDISTSLAPWLSVRDSLKAISFYKSAFNAIEIYRLETPDGGVVVKLSVDGAEFWLSGEAGNNDVSEEMVGGGTVKMILTVKNPDALFEQTLNAGATEVFAVQQDFGWRLGRLVDPFGLHWEIGHPLQRGLNKDLTNEQNLNNK